MPSLFKPFAVPDSELCDMPNYFQDLLLILSREESN
jgi:hypothetical protein